MHMEKTSPRPTQDDEIEKVNVNTKAHLRPEMASSPPSHVLDLPPLYTRPSHGALLIVLHQLVSGLNSFGPPFERVQTETANVSLDGLPRYLTGIVSSPLQWIEDDVQREEIWELASRRISERAGRAAAPSAHRTFTIPPPQRTNGAPPKPFQITLHEPSLTEDNLGHKTWAASYILAAHLPSILPHLLPACSPKSATQAILELGSGTGLLGLAFAALTATHLHLTDLPAIIPNLEKNIALNAEVLSEHGGSAEAYALDWSLAPSLRLSSDGSENVEDTNPTPEASEEDSKVSSRNYTLILTSDPVYSPFHPEILVNTVAAYLSSEPRSRVVSALPLRQGYAVERADFEERMGKAGLVVVEEGVVKGWGDDWGTGEEEEEEEEVKAKWAIWEWM